jgi:small subunit ribosomal protein S6e
MVKFKVVIADPKQGKSLQKEVDSTEVTIFKRKKIGDKIDGKELGLDGYELEITGGSDSSGFPMRKDVDGIARKKVLVVSGVGLRKKTRDGMRKRKLVRGNTVSLNVAQINTKIVKYGKSKLDFGKEGEEAPAEEKKEEPKKEVKEEKKEEPKQEKVEDKKEEKVEEKTEKTESKEEKKEQKEDSKKEEKKEDKEEVKEDKTEDKEETKPDKKEEAKEDSKKEEPDKDKSAKEDKNKDKKSEKKQDKK